MKNRKKTLPASKTASAVTVPGYDSVLSGIVELLDAARRASARTVNAIMTATYWEMGRRIVEHEQGGQERADYGEELVKRLSCDLTRRFGRGFSERNLRKCRAFYLGWSIWPTVSAKSQDEKCPTMSGKSDAEIRPTASAESDSMNFSALSRKSPPLAISPLRSIAARLPLPWSHYVRLLSGCSYVSTKPRYRVRDCWPRKSEKQEDNWSRAPPAIHRDPCELCLTISPSMFVG